MGFVKTFPSVGNRADRMLVLKQPEPKSAQAAGASCCDLLGPATRPRHWDGGSRARPSEGVTAGCRPGRDSGRKSLWPLSSAGQQHLDSEGTFETGSGFGFRNRSQPTRGKMREVNKSLESRPNGAQGTPHSPGNL